MISKKASRKFLSRRLDNYDWIKKYKAHELDEALNLLKPIPDFGKVKLWAHQKACFLILNEIRRFLTFIDMGGGKTLLMLMLIRYRKQCGDDIKAIVFVPYITSIETWVEQVKEHAPELNCVPLLGTGEQNLERISGPGDLFVACYQSAVHMVTDKVPGKKNNKKIKWKLEAKKVRNYFSDFNMLIMDEIHKNKDCNSLSYRMCRAISSQADWVVGLTGTPFGRDLADLWTQFNLIDFGETLGPTLGLYREVFFEKKDKYWGGFDYKFKKELLPVLKSTIKNASIRYEIEDLHDMPPKEYIKRHFKLPDESEAYVRQAVEKLNAGVTNGNLREVESSYLKLRQLASGFMTLRDDNDTKLQVKFETNPKLDELQNIIENIPPDRKIVIFHHFVYTSTLISDRLKQLKIKHARIWSGQKDPIGQLRLFKTDPAVQALVLNDKSGSSSLNLQNANYLVFFEQPDSPIDRQQGERRVWRPGQNKRVIIYDFLMKGTADVTLYHSNKSGENLLQALLGGKPLK